MSSIREIWSYECEWDGCSKVSKAKQHQTKAISLSKLLNGYMLIPGLHPYGRASRVHQPSRPTIADI